MDTGSRTIFGVLIFAFGVLMAYQILFSEADTFSMTIGVASGMFIAGVGLYLFLHRSEDQIKETKKTSKKSKKE